MMDFDPKHMFAAMAEHLPRNGAQRSRAHRQRMRAAGYRAAEVWRLDTANPSVRARIERQLRKIAEATDETDWMVEPEIADWR